MPATSSKSRRDQQDRQPLVDHAFWSSLVDLRLRADVNAERRLLEDEQPAPRLHPPRHHDLLLVPARQSGDQALENRLDGPRSAATQRAQRSTLNPPASPAGTDSRRRSVDLGIDFRAASDSARGSPRLVCSTRSRAGGGLRVLVAGLALSTRPPPSETEPEAIRDVAENSASDNVVAGAA